jgi:alpha-tubulin suppressor-like RCC1 family protein
LWAWGPGGSGTLGNNLTSTRSSPVSVVGGFTDWCQVSVGERHMVALRTNGTLWTWGFGGNGRLGDGTTVGKSSPVSIIALQGTWAEVDAGSNFNMAISKGII